MTKEEIAVIFDKLRTAIYDYDSYHVFYYIKDEEWSSDFTCVSLTVVGVSDQDEGSEWAESWGISSDGTLNADGEIYATLDDLIAARLS